MDIGKLLGDVEGGYHISEEEAAALLKVRGRGMFEILSTADSLRVERAGPVVTYVRNQNIHITNICKNLCGFCGFGRKEEDEGAFCDDRDTILKKVALAASRDVTEICLLSGVHPGFTMETYEEFLMTIHGAAPGIHIHAFSPDEVMHAARQSSIPTREVLERMKSAGLSSLQGTAAEILADHVRSVICPRKVSVADWVRIIREAHRLGIPTTATIMYGTCETEGDRARHLALLREIQEDTGGFTELVPLSYVFQNTPLYRSGIAGPGASGREDLLLVAVSRIFLHNFRNIQVSWGKLGLKLGQLALLSGANDLAGTMFSDDVSGDAGASGADYLDPAMMEFIVRDLGRSLRQRHTDYTLV
jgi:5-amino-6-(D-ribitylamino)uracil---L-tyrosine 4-hydroxyphenyl transferase